MGKLQCGVQICHPGMVSLGQEDPVCVCQFKLPHWNQWAAWSYPFFFPIGKPIEKLLHGGRTGHSTHDPWDKKFLGRDRIAISPVQAQSSHSPHEINGNKEKRHQTHLM